MDEVKAIAHDDKRKLVCQLGLLRKGRGLHWFVSVTSHRVAAE